MHAARLVALLALLIVAFFQAPSVARGKEPSRPNIVLIMADDMGYSDIGCYGGEIETPRLDRLAGNGLRFTQFYNTGRCCPTRASLMTGLYPHQAGVGHMMGDRGLPGYRGDLGSNCRTIAEVLRTAGYATYMSGKWHVTKKISPQSDADKHNWPRQRGFDRFFGTIHGAGSFYDPNTLTLDNRYITPDEVAEPGSFYYTDAIAEHATDFIQKHEGAKPFFLYVAFTAPHWPMHARGEDIKKYDGRYAAGWDALRVERHQRLIELGIVDKSWPLTPRDPAAPTWDRVEDKAWFERRMEVYAAMVDVLDRGVGRIVDALAEREQLDDTLIFFLADNGGCAEEYGSRGPVRPRPGTVIEPLAKDTLQTRMQPRITRDGKPVRTGRGVMPGPADTYIAYGLPWANASNTPFRLYKHFVHEGGISTPLIVHWPAKITSSRRGKLEPQPGHLIDIMATCVDVAGATYPESVDGQAITPLEGVSLRPALNGDALQRTRPLFWEHEGNRAIRAGKWKLVARGARGPWELYDLADDRTELNNLAAEQPERVKQMAAAWEAWAGRAKVKPWPWK